MLKLSATHRQESARIGGIGSCGRELCCSTWLTDFRSVNTSAARYQNLSLNPLKLSGQCGRLKCCLNYELDTYINAVKEIPEVKGPLKTKEGLVFLQKTDIFKRLMWFSYANDNNWIEVEVERVHEIMEMNKLGIDVYSLVLNEEEIQEDLEINSDLLALDKKLKKKSGDTSRPKKQKGSLENKNRVNSVTREKSNSKLESKSKSIKNEAKPKVSKAINTQQETKNTVKRENIAPKRENIQSNPHKIEIDSKSNIPNNQEHQKVNIQKRQSVVKNTEVTKGIQEVKKTTEKPKKTTQETPKPLENIAKQEGSAKIWKRQNVQNNNNEEQ